MDKRLLRQWCMLAGITIVVLFLSAAPSSPAVRREHKVPHVNVTLMDTGHTVALAVGQQLVVSVPLARYDDSYWYVVRNTGAGLKLIAGPNTKRRNDWTPFEKSKQIFYFERVAPGTVNLVLEQNYYAKPMILKVVDR